jgi:hypothetical protein
MNREEQEDQTLYKVVVNHEEQYSIWPADRENVRADNGLVTFLRQRIAYMNVVGNRQRISYTSVGRE